MRTAVAIFALEHGVIGQRILKFGRCADATLCARPPVRPSSARHSLRVRPGLFFARFEAPARPNVAHCAGQNMFSLLSASEFSKRRRPSGALARRRRRIRLAPTFFSACGERRGRIIQRPIRRLGIICCVLAARALSPCQNACSWACPVAICRACIAN